MQQFACPDCGSPCVWDNNPSYVGWWCETCKEPKFEDDEEDEEVEWEVF